MRNTRQANNAYTRPDSFYMSLTLSLPLRSYMIAGERPPECTQRLAYSIRIFTALAEHLAGGEHNTTFIILYEIHFTVCTELWLLELVV